MSLVLKTLRMAFANCGRLGCLRSEAFEIASEKDAIRELQSRGWEHTSTRTRCPDHQQRTAES